jgi:uncharacterized membrane protein
MIAGDLDAGIKTPVTGRKKVMDRAYRIGKELLEE